MCDIRLYFDLYNAYVGQPGAYAARRVRWARELIRCHRSHCDECREDGLRTNYNAVEPKTITHRMKGVRV